MFSPKDYLYTIATKRKAYFAQLLEQEDINLLEVEILLFLHTHPSANTLTEITSAKDFTKSHVSTALSHLEASGYLSKQTTPHNKKTLRITLLPKSQPLIQGILACLERFHAQAFADITPDEIEQMDRLLCKICTNLKESSPCKH